ncbi:DUF447 domain-containing protein [Halegenticoccus soli]|uniref:DUF447 domain-containing protein n=1 Tax=Halegenticoccus soli TaxID=1985678 RepID=UPI000C6D7A71|nr:DUF447 domain-containing protein [Halegenticoccus soli]
MSGDDGDDPGASGREWPVDLRGVTESIAATLGPNGLWNAAALGLRAPDSEGEPVTATTWGDTRTRRNFRRRGGGVVQFTSDPREFVDAALTIREEDDPVLPGADAWVEVRAERVDSGESDGTRWERWALAPVDSAVLRERVPTINRGFCAVVDATVAASRLDVAAYDTAALLDRLTYFEETVRTCGGPAEVEAFERLSEVTDWRSLRGR